MIDQELDDYPDGLVDADIDNMYAYKINTKEADQLIKCYLEIMETKNNKRKEIENWFEE